MDVVFILKFNHQSKTYVNLSVYYECDYIFVTNFMLWYAYKISLKSLM